MSGEEVADEKTEADDLIQEIALLKSQLAGKEQTISEIIIEKNDNERLFHEAKWLLKYIAKRDLNARAMKLAAENFMSGLTEDEKPDIANITELEAFEKVKQSDIRCPFCSRQRWIIMKHLENDHGDKTVSMQCTFCGSTWQEVYHLVDVRMQK